MQKRILFLSVNIFSDLFKRFNKISHKEQGGYYSESKKSNVCINDSRSNLRNGSRSKCRR